MEEELIIQENEYQIKIFDSRQQKAKIALVAMIQKNENENIILEFIDDHVNEFVAEALVECDKPELFRKSDRLINFIFSKTQREDIIEYMNKNNIH